MTARSESSAWTSTRSSTSIASPTSSCWQPSWSQWSWPTSAAGVQDGGSWRCEGTSALLPRLESTSSRRSFWAFAIAAAIAGLAGTLLAYRYPVVTFGQYGVFANVTAVGFAVIGGVGSPLGALLGGQLYPAGIGSSVADKVIAANAPVTMALIGGILLLVFTIVFSPDGIVVAAAQGITNARRRIPASVRATAARVPRLRRATVEQKVLSAAVGATSHRVVAAVLEVNDVSVRFGAVRAVDGVDLRVSPGEVVGLIGPNGAGKTTLIDAITGFVSSTGSVMLGGRDLAALSTRPGKCGPGALVAVARAVRRPVRARQPPGCRGRVTRARMLSIWSIPSEGGRPRQCWLRSAHSSSVPTWARRRAT